MTDPSNLTELAAAIREWFRAVTAEQAARNQRKLIESAILRATDTEAGGACDVYWPLVVDGTAISNEKGSLTMRKCQPLLTPSEEVCAAWLAAKPPPPPPVDEKDIPF